MKQNKIYKLSLASLMIFSLTACGSGGGGSSAPSDDELMVRYSGSTESAVLSENDIYPILNYLFNGDISTLSSLNETKSVVIKAVSNSLEKADESIVIGLKSQQTVNCIYGGDITVSENLNQNTGVGTVSYTYEQCDTGDVVTSGKVVYDYSLWLGLEPSDFDVVYKDFIEQYSDSYKKVEGSISFEGVGTCQEATTSDLLIETDSASVLEQGLKIIQSFCDTTYPRTEVTGRLYFSNLGYVDVAAPNSITFDNNLELLSGKILLSNEQSRITIDTTDSISNVSVDSDNDETVDFSVTSPSWHFTEQPYSKVRDNKGFLIVPDSGVALSKFITVGKLSHDIDILNSNGLTTTTWIATTEDSWLTVTPSGTTAEQLSITADATDLAVDTFYKARIMVSSTDPGIQNTQTINVGLWVGSSDPLARASLSKKYYYTASDPVRPYAYFHSIDGNIDVYNIYDQSLVSTIDTGIEDFGMAEMEVSANGESLYIADINEQSITVIDLDTPENRTHWSSLDPLYSGFTLSNTNGKELLISGYGNIYDAQTGYLYLTDSHTPISEEEDDLYGNPSSDPEDYSRLDASLFGNRFCALKETYLTCYALNYRRYSDKVVISDIATPVSTSNGGVDVALNIDGTIAYTASLGADGFSVVDINSMSFLDALDSGRYPAAVEVGSDNALHGAIDKSSSHNEPTDVWIYESNGVLRSAEELSDYQRVMERGLAISGDGFISVILADSTYNGEDTAVFISTF